MTREKLRKIQFCSTRWLICWKSNYWRTTKETRL